MLYIKTPNGRYQPADTNTIVNEAIAVYHSKLATGQTLQSPMAAAKALHARLGSLEHEEMVVVFLNSQNQILITETVAIGTIASASVYPREIAKRALQLNAAGIILAHNHPSGVNQPSPADIKLTERVVAAVGLFDIRVLDHIIIGAEPYSFAENRLL